MTKLSTQHRQNGIGMYVDKVSPKYCRKKNQVQHNKDIKKSRLRELKTSILKDLNFRIVSLSHMLD